VVEAMEGIIRITFMDHLELRGFSEPLRNLSCGYRVMHHIHSHQNFSKPNPGSERKMGVSAKRRSVLSLIYSNSIDVVKDFE